jgi:hypothetical protein
MIISLKILIIKKNQTFSWDNLQTNPNFIQDLADFESTTSDLTWQAVGTQSQVSSLALSL